ncbi:hypothetical protein KP509_02G006100 [Ceratopteris richardii]|uniref:HMA domain-containing protein n=1 Tax=Ceratopteris richardii TaxID=49495 RepID=A0A8T2V6Q6_CERRI|nr:hypothetical protein KP509_02G006100 [Ceratopteris richardii]
MPEEEKKEDDKIILQVDMHCEGCKAKVRKALKEFRGVEGLEVNMQDQKVTIKGKLDAKKVFETVRKKSGKRTVLIYPDPCKLAEDAEKKAKEEPKKEEPPPPDPEVTVVLKVNMHCRACAKQIRKSLLKMDGVTEAKEDFSKGIVTVKGKSLDPSKLCSKVKKRSGKHCEVVPPPPPPPAPPEEKKEEAKPAEEQKDEAKPAEEEAKKEEPPAETDAPAAAADCAAAAAPAADAAPAPAADAAPAPAADAAPPAETETKPEEKKEEEKKEANQEEKKEEKAEESKEEKKEAAPAEESKVEIKKYEYIPSYRSVPEYYVYPPQIFSDENPNACSVM